MTNSVANSSSSSITGPILLSPGTSLARNMPANPGEALASESSIESIRAWAFLLNINAACKLLGGIGTSSVYSASPVT